jgi:hypothetical protein
MFTRDPANWRLPLYLEQALLVSWRPVPVARSTALSKPKCGTVLAYDPV